MSKNHDENQIKKQPEKPISNRRKNTPIVNFTVNAGVNKVENENTDKDINDSNDKTIIINIVIPENDNSHQITANRISKRAYWINGGLFICTMVLAGISMWQGCLTRKSVAISDSVFNATKKYNDSSLRIQKQTLDSQTSAKKQSDIADAAKLKRDTDFTNKQEAGIDSQISAIKQSQKQFEISHSPYITVVGFGKNLADSLEIDIKNQGNQVAYLIETDYAVKAEKNDRAFEKFKTPKDWLQWLDIPKRNLYNMQDVIAPGGGFQLFKTLKSVSDADMALVMQRKKILFIRVAIYYFNTTTSRIMRFDFIAGWNPVDNLSGNIYFNYTVIKKYPE